MVLPNQQVSVHGHHDVGDVGAHFERLAEISQHYYFKILSELGAVNRRAERHA
jgi:hypothetical protein